MSDDIVTRLRGAAAGFRIAVGTNDSFTFPTLHSEAADEIERLRADRDRLRDDRNRYKEFTKRAYWNMRAAIESAQHCLISPHPLWSELNEIMENLDGAEKLLDIPNRWESMAVRGDR